MKIVFAVLPHLIIAVALLGLAFKYFGSAKLGARLEWQPSPIGYGESRAGCMEAISSIRQ